MGHALSCGGWEVEKDVWAGSWELRVCAVARTCWRCQLGEHLADLPSARLSLEEIAARFSAPAACTASGHNARRNSERMSQSSRMPYSIHHLKLLTLPNPFYSRPLSCRAVVAPISLALPCRAPLAAHLTMSVHATALSSKHEFSKTSRSSITLIRGMGVEDDCHAGEFVQHRSRLHIRPRPANLRQVHLQSLEMLRSVDVEPSTLGENITTEGIELSRLGRGDRLHFVPRVVLDEDQDEEKWRDVPHAVVCVQGLRNPCPQIERYRKGLQEKFIVRDEQRAIIRRLAGAMGTVEEGGPVAVGMAIVLEPAEVFEQLGPV
jgi:hypothetical protein